MRAEQLEDLVDLIRLDDLLGKEIINLTEQEKPLFGANGEKVAYPLELLFDSQ